jgi:hypothetical protein
MLGALSIGQYQNVAVRSNHIITVFALNVFQLSDFLCEKVLKSYAKTPYKTEYKAIFLGSSNTEN